jgi:DNA-binding MarR family transcriptional regulator
MRTSDLIRRAVSAVVDGQGITLQQYNVLRILRGAGEGGLPTLEIAERMIEQTPGITRLLDRLEGKALVRRERCPTDRRQVTCRITAEGLSLLQRLDAPVADAERVALSGLTPPQLQQLIELLDRTRNGLHAALDARRVEIRQEAS